MGKKWIKPKLVVLVRSRPGESVLSSCKQSDAGSGPSGADSYCSNTTLPCTGVCSATMGS